MNKYNLPNKTIDNLMTKLDSQFKNGKITSTVELRPGPNFGKSEEDIRLDKEFIIELLDTIDWDTVEKQKEQWGSDDWHLVLEEAGIDKERIRIRLRSENIKWWEYVSFCYILPESFMNIFWDLLDSDYVERYQNISYAFAVKHKLDIVYIVENNKELSIENEKSFQTHYKLAKMFK